MEFTTPITAAEVDVVMWRAWLADPDTRRRFEALVYRRGDGCAYWTGALSSTGHGKFPAGSGSGPKPGPVCQAGS